MVELTRARVIKAYRAGNRAGAAGWPPSSNPYGDVYSVAGRALARYWLRGWRLGAASTPTT